MSNSKTIIYFDSSDPANVGIAYRTRHADGSEDSGPVDGPASVAAQALLNGEVPRDEDLVDLRSTFGFDVVLDGVGEIFPGWEAE